MAETATRVSRKWLYIAWALGALVFLAYVLIWRYAAGEMKTAVNDWVADQRAAGLSVAHGPVTSDGFPFFLRVHIDAPDIASQDQWRWKADRLTLDALPYDLSRLIFSPTGEQWIETAEGGRWRYTADDLRASIAKDKERGWVFAVTIANALSSQVDSAENLSLGELIVDVAPAPGDPSTLTLSLAARDIVYKYGPGADDPISVTRFDTALALSQSDMLIGPDPLEIWRRAAGKLTIMGLSANINGAELSLTGALAIDPEGWPDGKITTMIRKPAGLAPAIARTGALGPREAQAAAAGLAMAAIASGGAIEAPIVLENGVATIAGVKIADLPKVTNPPLP